MPKSGLSFSCFALAILLAWPVVSGGQAAEPAEQSRIEFFEKQIRPVLADNCYNCHSANTNSKGGLRVDDRNGLIHGGDRGPAVVPGDPEKSLLIQAVRHAHAEVKMPPMKHLSDDQVADLTQWIKDGAAWPKVHAELPTSDPDPEYAGLRREHWAWQPLRKPKTPNVNDASWPRDDIDRFVLAALEAKGLAPVPDADPLTFIRRVTFDFTGLPPSTDEAEEFVAAWEAADPDARRLLLEKLVDRLLGSPAYGERWGRHWLDVARYGESTGSARNIPYPHAWRYRDYVIDALNSDKPYDQFLREQIAGDLLPAESQRQRDEQLIATGFLALGVCDVNQRFKVRFVMDNIDEQIDTVTRAVLGLTVSCARCHDHKFDPIPLTDYYALAGIFHSSQRCAGVRNKMGGGGLDYYDTAMLLPLGSQEQDDGKIAEQVEQAKAELAQARAQVLTLQEGPDQNAGGPEREKELAAARKQVAKVQSALVALADPAARGPVALGVRDASTVGDTEIRVRGEAEQLGPVVARGFLTVFDVPGKPEINPNQSGRLELAEWLVSKHNPLTPRVMANRVWQHLFGRGLVSTVDNFGVTGDAPSHPELLDHLAIRFIENGWSVKKLVRAVVLSRAYQLGSEAPAVNVAADPGNRLVWRHSPRRLDAEEIRDAMLAAAGQLDLHRPEGSPAKDFKVVELRNNGPEAERLAAQCLASKCRSVYLPLVRGLTPHALGVFDFAEQGMVTGRRDTTTVATQALFLLNDPFVRQQSQALTDRLIGQSDLDDADRIALAYRLALCRPATAAEIDRAKRYLAEYEAAAREEGTPSADPRAAAWASLCQAILASAEFRYIR
ncbi:MAG: PSD1 domain-containing protein [Planctomycetia bacterium]|nr:PSD1 domain-containing protein [Planctomycetia bacterium]